ncbi:hypothetical protein OAV62_01020 [bacterium]|nr:hypothetical protein [bacterium]
MEKTMSLGTWDPQNTATDPINKITDAPLQQFIDLSKQNLLDTLDSQLSKEDIQKWASLMSIDASSWNDITDNFNHEDIEHLIRFFTIAESLPGWTAGDKSPVIYLGKILKQQGKRIDKELTLWIKSNSNNQFLPHGPLI